jgi:AcrR family transcriptional regulator
MSKFVEPLPKQHIGANAVKDGMRCGLPEKVDPRVKRTRKLIMQALRDLMQERSFGELSVLDIAQRATINRATFYAHFEDKYHLAESMIREGLIEAVLDRISPPAPFDAEHLQIVVESTMEFMGCLLSTHSRREADFVASFGVTVQETLEVRFLDWMAHENGIRNRIPGTPEATANALAWSIYGAAVRWAHAHKRRPASEVAAETVELFLK